MLILNKIQLTGRVGRVSTRDYQDKQFVTLRISVPEKYTKQDQKPEDMWFTVVVNGKAAEFAGKYVAVGDYIFVDGRLKEHKYQDKQGVDRTELQVYANELQIVLKKNTDEAKSAPVDARDAQPPVNPHLADLVDEGDGDLPF